MTTTMSTSSKPPSNTLIHVSMINADTFTGFVHCYDQDSGLLILMTSPPSPTFHILNINQISSWQVTDQKRRSPAIPKHLNESQLLEEGEARLKHATRQCQIEQSRKKLLDGLSPLGQQVFEKFSDLYPTEIDPSNKSIIVSSTFVIKPPYKRVTASAGADAPPQEVERIHKMLLSFSKQ
ncbi:hypothetical protein P9112_002578 [Eukaryota sp. TZLM1-RC]